MCVQGYLPANMERRELVLRRKRDEYFGFIEQYYHSRTDDNYRDTYRQVDTDRQLDTDRQVDTYRPVDTYRQVFCSPCHVNSPLSLTSYSSDPH